MSDGHEPSNPKLRPPREARGNGDPTTNVLDLVDAANQRQDDLRAADSRRINELAELREAHAAEFLDLRAKLGEKGEECSSEMADLRAAHAEQLRKAEAQRIDAIREVDVKAVQAAAEVQATAATALATNVAEAAVVMRTQVDAAATAAATALNAALQPITKDIADLRQAQYEAQGQKTQTTESQSRSANVGLWVGLAAAVFFGFASLVAAIIVAVVP